ncbi:hypothetical protein [Leptospira levettii]|uniref:hypothetical protein n=1 Tax=Leptospira levettii TaxID=2023178 RepID=UPI001082A0B0|nr:hypothetical protein [Leptospira levettii]TGL14934.1 hypothetical protein EHQ39_00020 [Leptospira levettii]
MEESTSFKFLKHLSAGDVISFVSILLGIYGLYFHMPEEIKKLESSFETQILYKSSEILYNTDIQKGNINIELLYGIHEPFLAQKQIPKFGITQFRTIINKYIDNDRTLTNKEKIRYKFKVAKLLEDEFNNVRKIVVLEIENNSNLFSLSQLFLWLILFLLLLMLYYSVKKIRRNVKIKAKKEKREKIVEEEYYRKIKENDYLDYPVINSIKSDMRNDLEKLRINNFTDLELKDRYKQSVYKIEYKRKKIILGIISSKERISAYYFYPYKRIANSEKAHLILFMQGHLSETCTESIFEILNDKKINQKYLIYPNYSSLKLEEALKSI